MKKLVLTLLLGAAPLCAQNPQIPVTGTLGAGGVFPAICTTSILFPSDANYTPSYPAMACSSGVMIVHSAVSLTAARNLVLPVTQGFNWKIENLTTGSQSVQVIGPSGAGVTIANGSATVVLADGTNYVSAGGGGGGGAVSSVFTRTGAVVAATNDYNFSQLAGQLAIAQFPNATANSVLVGAGASGSGSHYGEITLGSNLSMSGTTLNATGSGGVTSFTGDGNLLNNSASTGSVTATLAVATAHKYWGNNTGSTAAPGYETIGAADLPATLFTDSKYYPAAVCNNAGAFSAALNVLDNNQPVGTCYNTATSTDASLNFNVVPVGGTNQYAQGYANLPAYWTGTNITLYFTANINTGNFVWNIETACPAASGSTPGSPTWGSASTSTVSTPGTIGQQASVTISGIAANSVNGCPATGTTTPSEMTFRVFVTAGTATGSTSVAQLVGYTLSTSRSQ